MGARLPRQMTLFIRGTESLEDPASAQRYLMEAIESITAIDDATFEIHTKTPAASLLSAIFGTFAITSAELYKKNGSDADRKTPLGRGPYKLNQFVRDQRIVLSRNNRWPGLDARAPTTAVFQRIQEPDQRVTALLAGEVQIARQIPPQLVS